MDEELEFAKKFLKDKIALGLLVIGILFLMLGALNTFGVSLGNNFIGQAVSIFTPTLWIILSASVIISSILAYFKKYNLMVILLLIALLGTTAFIRTSNMPNLKDVTTGDWTLGPDLDPFLYLRHANEIANGTLQNPDVMRAAPVGTQNYAYKNLMPWAIVLVHKITSIFSPVSMTYAAIIAPVIFFCISIIGFFLFMYSLSLFKFSKKNSMVIALLASVLYSIIPSMVSRTVAGDPEIESLGMIFFWFAFLFYTLAWKKDKVSHKITFSLLAGICTGLMSWTWGGYKYIYMVLSLTTLILFFFGKEDKNNKIIFASWAIPALIFEFFRFEKIIPVLTSVSDTGFAFFVLLLFGASWILSRTKIKEKVEKINLPTPLLSIFSVGILAAIILLIVNRELLMSVVSRAIEGFLYPWGRERIGLTVAENRAPYFSEALGEFGNLIWVFLISICFLFYKAVIHFKKSGHGEFDKGIYAIVASMSLIILIYSGNALLGANYSSMIGQIDFLVMIPMFFSFMGAIYFFTKKNHFLSFNFSFIFMVLAIMFSRISSPSMFLNGDGLFSKLIYFSGLLLFVAIVGITYLVAYRNKDEDTLKSFKEINIMYIVILAFSFWGIVSIRGAIRLFFIISPILIIASSFIFAEINESAKGSNKKVIWAVLIILLLVFAQIFTVYTLQTEAASKSMVPSSYNQQWQRAMQWVRDSTPAGSIFVHWWDYGYWVQTIGERPTVVDGGHPSGFWDHLVGRYVLTATSPEMALSMMKTDNVSYLLIDSSDVGKYAAFSKIGSDDAGEDRFSQIPVFATDHSQTRETSNRTLKVYRGGGLVDEDIVYSSGNTSGDIFLPKESSFLAFIVLESSEEGIQTTVFNQPRAIFIYNNQQISIPVRYLYYHERLIDFKGGLNATIKIVPSVAPIGNNQMQADDTGATVYLSPKVTDSLLAQLYLLNSKKGRYSEFELVHSEQDAFINYLNSIGKNVGEFVAVSGELRGPIKIWKVNPDSNIVVNEEFLRTSGKYAEFDNLTFSR